MKFEDAEHEATHLRVRIRGDRFLRSNPTNWYHDDYTQACDRFFVLFLLFMYLVVRISYDGLAGFVAGLLSMALSVLIIAAFFITVATVIDGAKGFWSWITNDPELDNY